MTHYRGLTVAPLEASLYVAYKEKKKMVELSQRKPNQSNSGADKAAGTEQQFQTNSHEPVDYAELIGGGNALSSVNSGFNKLYEQMLELKKESGDALNKLNIKLITDPRLSSFGDILVVSAVLNQQVFAVAMLPGEASVEREYAGTSNNPLDRETVRKSIDDIVRQRNDDGSRPFQELLYEHLVTPGSDVTVDNIFVANSYPVYMNQEVDVKALLRNARYDIINYLQVKIGATGKAAIELMSKLSQDINIEVTRGIGLKDSLGNPQFAPVVIAMSQKVKQPFGSGSVASRIAEIRGYVEALPLSQHRAHQLRLAKANQQGVSVESVDAPRLKPIFVARGVEWLTDQPAATLEGMIMSLASIAYLTESPAWLKASIAEKDAGSYDMASVGLFAPGVAKPAPIAKYHDRKFLDDDGMLQGHIQKFWDNFSVAIDVPMSGPGKTVLEALGSSARINAALTAVFGQNAVLLQGNAIADNLGAIPVGVYNDKGTLRDTRALTNAVTVATRYQGDLNAINEFLGTYWQWDNNRADSIFAARLTRLHELAGTNELTIRGEDVRLIISDELIAVLKENLVRAKTINTHTVKAQQEGQAGFGDAWGDGLSHGAGAQAAGTNTFSGFNSYL